MTLFDLVAKLTLDSSQYEQGLSGASRSASEFATSVPNKIGRSFATIAKVGAAAVGAASAALTKITKDAIANYAEFEQLVGGVETLFAESADSVLQYAQNAFKTAGLSANEYMATVTSFSASLLQSLGGDTAEAAKIADMAITDMSDNANKMGTDMAAIQNAYQGFAKQNYTMLDNLKLGYGGTRSEMERLLKDASALTGIKYDIDNLSDVYEAIHVIQTEIGITGTTAKEASSTIQGSVAAMKSAWQNLVTGIADENADFEKLVKDFSESAITASENILPRIEQSLTGIGMFIDSVAPTIINEIPKIINKALPKLTKSGAKLVSTLVQAIVKSLPDLLKTGIFAITEFANGVVEGLPEAIPKTVDAVLQIVDAITDPNNIVSLVDAGLQIIVALADGIINSLPVLLDRLPVIVENIVAVLVESAPLIVDAAGQILLALVNYFLDPANQGQIRSVGNQMVLSIVGGIGDFLWNVAEAGAEIVDSLVGALANAAGLGPLYEQGKGALGEFVRGLRESLQTELPDLASNVYSNLASDLESAETLADVYNAGAKAFREFIRGIYESMPELWGILEGIFAFSGNPGAMMAFDQLEQSLAEEGASSFGSAATKMVEGAQTEMTSAGEEMADLLLDSFEAKGIDASMLAADNIPPAFSGAFKSHNGEFEADGSEAGEAVGRGIVSGLDLSKSAAIQAAIELARSVIQSFKSELQISSPSKVTREFGRFFDQGFALGITDELDAISDAADKAAATASEALSAGAGAVDYVVGDMTAQRNQTAPGQSGAWGDVVALLGEIRDKIGGDVVLDSGQLVGYMDAALGSLSVRKARGGSFA